MTKNRKTEHPPVIQRDFDEKLLNTSSLGSAIFTPDGKCLSGNEAMKSIVGPMSELAVQEEWIETVAWQKFGLLVDKEEVLSKGVEKRREIHLVTTSQDDLWLDCRLNVLATDDGPRLLLLVDDITHQKQAENALRESEEMLRGILSVSPVGIGLTQDRKIKWVNEAWAKMFGFESKDEWEGKSARLVYASREEYERVGKLLYESVAPGEGAETDAKFRTKDGTRFDGYVRIRALDPAEPDKGTIAIMYDITDRKKAEEALRESEERFRTLFEAAEDAIFIKDSDLRYTYVNPAMEELFGMPSSKILGRRAEHFFGEETGKLIRDSDNRVLAGQSVENEYTRTLQRVSRTVHEIRVPLKNIAGHIVGICGISREVTESKSAALARVIPVPEQYPSPAMQAALRQAKYAAAADSIILLLGESGSGKDYLARWIHDHSRRSSGPYFALNCAAISKELAESELFGHEAGAFTGAGGRKRGLLELAEGGTLLLNEIGELPLSLQSKLLTFLDTKSFLRVGGDKAIHINARLIAATNRNLETEVSEGRFLSALFYRLNVFAIEVPALRDRTEDIPMLAEEIMSALAVELQVAAPLPLDSRDMNLLKRYTWPGNVRELRNVLERALMLSSGGRLNIMLPSREDFSDEWAHVVRFVPSRPLHEVLDEVTHALVDFALQYCRGSKKETARLLKISRGALYRYMTRLGITRDNGTHN